jgi:DNA-binding HxlR family transcriptional regulator
MCLCSLEYILETLGKKWAILIIDKIAKHKKLRFNDLQSMLEGISPSTLAAILKKLESSDLIQRKAYDEIPPKVEYSLSKNGNEFRKLIEPLIEWSQNYDSLHCKCNTNNQNYNDITKTSNEKLNRLIEASVCACMCLPMMASHFIFSVGIF